MKITKKFLKEQDIKNLKISKEYYNEYDLNELSKLDYTFYLNNNDLRLSLPEVENLEVEYASIAFWVVAIMKDGHKIFVEI